MQADTERSKRERRCQRLTPGRGSERVQSDCRFKRPGEISDFGAIATRFAASAQYAPNRSARARPVHIRACHLSSNRARSVATLGSRFEMVEISRDKRNGRDSQPPTPRESTRLNERAKQVYRSSSSRSRVSTSERERPETAFGRVFRSFGRPGDNGEFIWRSAHNKFSCFGALIS